MISRGRLSKSSLRVNKTKWCSRGRLRKTLYKPLNGSQTRNPCGENFWGWGGLLRFYPPLKNIKLRKNQIKTNNCFEGLHSKCMDKLQEMSQKGESERKLAWFSPPRDYFGDNSSREQKRRRSKFSGVRAFGKLLTEWLQLNNTAINRLAAPQGSV